MSGSDEPTRPCRSHHRQAIASRHSGRGSAAPSRRCIRSRKARLRRSVRKLRTFDHSGPVRSFSAAAISAAARVRSLSRPSASNNSSAAAARPQADSSRSASSKAAVARRQAAPAACAGPRASIPCRFAPATLASAPSAFSQAASARSPVPGQDPVGFHGGVEDVQPVLQRRGRGVVAPGRGPLRHRRGDPLGGIGDGELQPGERHQLSVPGRGLAVGRVAAEDGRHARRLDPDQGRSPPKKISSRARVRTRGAHAGSNAASTAPAR